MDSFKHLLRAALLSFSVFSALAAVSAQAADDEPSVTIRQGENLIEEYRINGFLYAVKVTPKDGVPYFLVRADGTEANFIRTDQPDMLIPSWQILSW